MPKVEIKQETLDFLQGLAKEINKQDNRSTRSPYYYVIWVQKLVLDACGEDYYYVDGESTTREDLEKMPVDEFVDTYGLEKAPTQTMSWKWVAGCNDSIFLTEKAAKKHLEQNRHHYGKDAVTYVKYFWRCPEMENLFKAIADVSGIDLEWH